MSARRLALLAVAVLLALAPLAAAGSQNDPETGDDMNDDVAVNGGVNCGLPAAPPFGTTCLWPASTDFEWANTDIDWAWVNDTADSLMITGQMKAGTAFAAGAEFFGSYPADASGFTYTYTFAFTVDGVPYAAIAVMGADGVFEISGVASEFLVHDGNRLTLTVPKTLVGATANGAVVGGLLFTAHGEDDNGMTTDDRAPDEDGASRDYAVANSTAAAQAPEANATGNASAGAPGQPVAGSSSGPRPPVSGGASTSERPFSVTLPPHQDPKETKDSPAAPWAFAAVALIGLALLRRRLQ